MEEYEQDDTIGMNDIDNIFVNNFDTDEMVLELNSEFIKYKDDYEIVNKIEISKNIYRGLLEFDPVNLYVIKNLENGKQYIGLDRIPICLWYEHDNINDILSIYDLDEYPNTYDRHERGFISTESDGNLDIDDLERYLIYNEYFEHLTWGSVWSDFPFREQATNGQMSVFDLARLAYYSLRQNDQNIVKISCKTKISKSIVTFESHYGALLVDIRYNSCVPNDQISLINEKLQRNYPLDIPLDVLVPLLNFPYENYKSILSVEQLNTYNIDTSLLLCHTKEMYTEIRMELVKLKESNDKTDELTSHIERSLDCIDFINGSIISSV